MDRSERTAIIEPIMLILKQRTGVASILGIVVGLTMFYFGLPTELILSTMGLIGVWVGGQKIVDANENSVSQLQRIRELDEKLGQLRDGVQGTEELREVVEEILETVEYLYSNFQTEDEEVVGES